MCVFFGEAAVVPREHYGGTIVGLSEAMVHNLGYRHTFFYQNNVANLSNGANCMLLHVPARSLTQTDFIGTEDHMKICENMVDTLQPPVLSRSMVETKDVTLGFSHNVEVFDHGVYTMVVAKNATDIIPSLNRVRVDRRPSMVQPELMEFYQRYFPDWFFVLCCFNNREVKTAPPIMFTYEPLFSNRFVAPGIDSHTGDSPDLSTKVDVDHWVIMGSHEAKHPALARVYYDKWERMDTMMKTALPKYIMGKRIRGKQKNADFLMSPQQLTTGSLQIERGIV